VKRSRFCASIVFFLPLYFDFSVNGLEGSLRFAESRSYSPGQVWLEWTSPERIERIHRRPRRRLPERVQGC